jgi:hypothetical protein
LPGQLPVQLERPNRIEPRYETQLNQVRQAQKDDQDGGANKNRLRPNFKPFGEILEMQTTRRRARLCVLDDLVRKYETQLNQVRQAQKDDQDGGANKNADVRGRTIFWHNQQLASYEKELLATESELRKARLKLGGLEAREKDFASEPVPEVELAEALLNHKAVSALNSEIGQLEASITRALSRSTLDEKDPEVIRLRGELKKLRAGAEQVRKEKKVELARELKELRRLRLRADLAAERANIATLTAGSKLLIADVDRVKGYLGRIERGGAKIDTLQGEISHLEGILKPLKHEREAIKIQLEVPSNVQVIEDAVVSSRGD